MKKGDLILAQKSLAARQIKLESMIIREELKQLKESYSGTSLKGSRELSSRRQLTSERSARGYNSTSDLNESLNRSSSLPVLPEIKQAQSPVGHGNNNKKEQYGFTLSKENESLVDELSKRTITDQASVRKKQVMVAQSLQAPPSRSNNNNNKNDIFSNDYVPSSRQGSSRRPATTSSATGNKMHASLDSTSGNKTATFTITEEEVTENFFMPKKQILRADGASLYDIYRSKKDDTWGKIIRAQYLEDEQRKIEAKKEKERQNERYGSLLRKQVEDIHAAQLSSQNENDVFAALENATAKRTEDLQKQRTQDAINRHKQFINNALEDIGIKHRQREKELKEELTASTLMVNNARRLIAEEEEKRRREKEYQKKYQETVFQENLASIERKQKAKSDSHAEDRRIIEERERQLERDRKRHEDEVNFRLQRSTEGPAHFIVQKIVDARKEQDANLYQTISQAPNLLNKQLKASEDAARERNESNGKNLEDEWVRNTEYKRKKKIEDEEKNNRIIATMQQMIRDQELEDIQKREAQRAAQRRYQQELDAQLAELRQRSIDTLQKTMSEEEMKYNTELIRKTSVYLK